jgi:predicted permease
MIAPLDLSIPLDSAMPVISTFAFVLALMATGRILRWRQWMPERAADLFNRIVLNVCLPAAILLHASKLTYQPELLGLIAIPWIVLAASIVLVLPMAKLLRFDRGSTANLLLQIPLGNTSFIGYALIPVLVGAGALRYAVVYDQLGSFLILATWGLFVVALFGGG